MTMSETTEERTRILALDARPRSFGEMVGAEKITEAVAALGTKPPAYMFIGNSGCGKTTISRILALSLQDDKGEFGNPDPAMWDRYGDYDIKEINASETRGVDDIAEIVSRAHYVPRPPSKRRVIILDEAQRLTAPAQNLLLKPFEDASASTTVWIICTTDPQKIIPALRGRCQKFKLPGLRSDGVRTLVKRVGKSQGLKKKAMADLCDELAMAGISSPRDVVQAIEQFVVHGDAAAAATQSAVGGDGVSAIDVARAVVNGDWKNLGPMLKELAQDDTDAVLRVVMGYLKSVVLGGAGGSKAVIASYGLRQISRILFLHEQEKTPALVGILYELTTRFAGKPWKL